MKVSREASEVDIGPAMAGTISAPALSNPRDRVSFVKQKRLRFSLEVTHPQPRPPRPEMRPELGLREYPPQSTAGMRIEPAVAEKDQ